MEELSIRQRIGRYVGKFISAWYRLKGCEIGSNCKISKSAVIDSAYPKGIHIGNHVYVGGGSIVTHDVPDHCIVAGNPARIRRR